MLSKTTFMGVDGKGGAVSQEAKVKQKVLEAASLSTKWGVEAWFVERCNIIWRVYLALEVKSSSDKSQRPFSLPNAEASPLLDATTVSIFHSDQGEQSSSENWEHYLHFPSPVFGRHRPHIEEVKVGCPCLQSHLAPEPGQRLISASSRPSPQLHWNQGRWMPGSAKLPLPSGSFGCPLLIYLEPRPLLQEQEGNCSSRTTHGASK
ncbi:hypothetical protein HJG60_011964 [Phyllostomus discolor]|uniref:Uncharacterized protein n=1 Tax=Phyllostomus discolor TaxID=89673 RepID=A0A834DW42_9CHIR|nr:hypothetical protein HJG60_011964 [Phyllostomus discolor]